MSNTDVSAKEYDMILVIGSGQDQAKFLWDAFRHKYSGRVRFLSRNEYMLDGYNPLTRKILIVLLDGHSFNPITKSKAFQYLVNNGAEVVEEKVEEER